MLNFVKSQAFQELKGRHMLLLILSPTVGLYSTGFFLSFAAKLFYLVKELIVLTIMSDRNETDDILQA